MKTSSLKSLTARLVVGAMLSSSVFAGPGPKGAVEIGRNTIGQPTTTIALSVTTTAKPQAKATKPTATYTRSNRYVYDLQGHVTVDF